MKAGKYFGPGTLVAAAFIGPGTVTSCTLAGVHSSYTLLWALMFSTLATLILQEMSARLGFASKAGLAEAVRMQFDRRIPRYLVMSLIFSAIFIGNAAYEAGNITGAELGMELLWRPFTFWPVILGLGCGLLLYTNSYKLIENTLTGLVLMMSLCFLITALLSSPDWAALFKGFIPSAPGKEDLILAMSLVGTTVVPYNLFLHASLTSRKWPSGTRLQDIRTENTVSILLGGFISILILIVAAANKGNITEVHSAMDLAVQLKPVLGDYAQYLMGFGLMAAGFSSAITAALAAALVIKGLSGNSGTKGRLFYNLSWFLVLVTGVSLSMTGIQSIVLIKFAQLTNALLLPVMAAFLLYACNTPRIMSSETNSRIQNCLGLLVILVSVGLSLKTFFIIF